MKSFAREFESTSHDLPVFPRFPQAEAENRISREHNRTIEETNLIVECEAFASCQCFAFSFIRKPKKGGMSLFLIDGQRVRSALSVCTGAVDRNA